jgi:hypothetical protein
VKGEIEQFICRGVNFFTRISTGVALGSAENALLVLPSFPASLLLHNVITLPLQFSLLSQGLIGLPNSLQEALYFHDFIFHMLQVVG